MDSGDYNRKGVGEKMIEKQVKKLRKLADFHNTEIYLSYEQRNTIIQAADTIEALSAKLQAANTERSAEDCGGWIPCSERLPEERVSELGNSMGEHVICSCKGGFVGRSFFYRGRFTELEEKGYKVLAWMPLLEPYHEP